MVAIMLVVASMPLMVGFTAWAEMQGFKSRWTIAGPPCPIVDHPSFTSFVRRPPRPFAYQGANFDFKIGDVSCIAPPNPGLFSKGNYAICQFSAPAVVAVRTRRQSVVYAPGVGRQVTVTTRGGIPSCVVGGWFGRPG